MDTPEHNPDVQHDGQIDPTVDWQKVAETAEQRRKDTQAAYTKGQQEIKALKAQLEQLQKMVAPPLELSDDERQDLDDLKLIDPDAWRVKMNKLEAQATEKVKEKLSEAERAAMDALEVERRYEVMQSFNEQHPDLVINDDVIANDVPPRFMKQLEKGEIEFEEFLDKVYTFLTKGKTVKNEETLDQPNLGKTGGGSTPQRNSQKQEPKYKDTIF